MADEKRIKQYELNKKLYEACIAEKVDYNHIKHLLSEGAEPLGIIELGDSNVYEEMLLTLVDYDRPQVLYDITKLFLNSGMNIANPPEPYDWNSVHPLDSFSLHSEHQVMDALELLLDNGIHANDAKECWEAIVEDTWMYGGCDIPLNAGGLDFFVEDLHKIFLIASYPHILSVDEDLQKFIWADKNDYDPCRFRNWKKYRFKVDMNSCIPNDSIYKALIFVIDENENEVWKFRFGE